MERPGFESRYLTTTVKSTWFLVIHYIIPTNAMLRRTHLRDTDTCQICHENTQLPSHDSAGD